MRKIVVFVGILACLAFGVSPAHAVENGVEESGNPFVVPISTNYNATQALWCSGTLIAPLVVVTAAHCVLDSNGLVSKKVFVGKAGTSAQLITQKDAATSVEISSNFRNGSDNKVGDDDLAFIVLSKSQEMTTPIRLASEAEVTAFKSSGSPLKIIGYGQFGNSNNDVMTTPKSFTGSFAPDVSTFANSAYVKSSVGNSCAGDSGGPILASSATSLILVGVLTGSAHNAGGSCSIKNPNGSYYTLFTLISRYTNLAFASALTSMNVLQGQVQSSNATIQKLTDDSAFALSDLADAQEQITSLQAQVKVLQGKVSSTITCTKGKLTQKVTALGAKCPSGFKVKI